MHPISVRFARFNWFSIKEKNQVNQMNQTLAWGTSLLVLLVHLVLQRKVKNQWNLALACTRVGMHPGAS